MRIFDTSTEAKVALDTSAPVGLYVCGITPYDTTHLGHAFTFAVYDVLVRYLRFRGARVTYVQNVTDIDDDILLKSASLGLGWRELGDRETRRYQEDMRALNNLPPDIFPCATEHLSEMIVVIRGLLENGVAYVANGNVYFEVNRDPGFGRRICRLDRRAQLTLANERGNYPEDPHKRDPLDFVLWQAAMEGEPIWPSPWGEGRPGWHIECSAMSTKYLGPTFALHGGGFDLAFPHHECELAQSLHYSGQPLARIWMHVAMVHYRQRKMSKSLGNMVFLRDLLGRHRADAVRLQLLGHHYRTPWNFEERETAEAERLAAALAGARAEGPAAEAEVVTYATAFLDALEDDLDTPRALRAIHELAQSEDPAARRVATRLCRQVLGLRLE